MSEPAYLRTIRAAYDTVAVDYAALLHTELAHKPFDRAMLGAFAELVRADRDGPIADLGCGPGRVTAFLHGMGSTVFGVDLSSAMVAEARRTYPDLRFDEGSMSCLDLADNSLGGVVAWYSIIHTPLELLTSIFVEFHRVLAPGGYLLLAFQTGDTVVHLEHAYGHTLSLDAYRLSPELVSEQLRESGLVVFARLLRDAEEPEKTPQAYLLARK
jgi:ubiquinone/menaquinone biosynthesis C-methylase UbiE